MTIDGWIKLGDLIMHEPAILALLCGIALIALAVAVWLDRPWRR